LTLCTLDDSSELSWLRIFTYLFLSLSTSRLKPSKECIQSEHSGTGQEILPLFRRSLKTWQSTVSNIYFDRIKKCMIRGSLWEVMRHDLLVENQVNKQSALRDSICHFLSIQTTRNISHKKVNHYRPYSQEITPKNCNSFGKIHKSDHASRVKMSTKSQHQHYFSISKIRFWILLHRYLGHESCTYLGHESCTIYFRAMVLLLIHILIMHSFPHCCKRG